MFDLGNMTKALDIGAKISSGGNPLDVLTKG